MPPQGTPSEQGVGRRYGDAAHIPRPRLARRPPCRPPRRERHQPLATATQEHTRHRLHRPRRRLARRHHDPPMGQAGGPLQHRPTGPRRFPRARHRPVRRQTRARQAVAYGETHDLGPICLLRRSARPAADPSNPRPSTGAGSPKAAAGRVKPVAGVELIQYGHRYGVVWPSIHPTGAGYGWYVNGGRHRPAPRRRHPIPVAPRPVGEDFTAADEIPADHPPADEHRETDWSDGCARSTRPPSQRSTTGAGLRPRGHPQQVDAPPPPRTGGPRRRHRRPRHPRGTLRRRRHRPHPNRRSPHDGSQPRARAEWRRLLDGGPHQSPHHRTTPPRSTATATTNPHPGSTSERGRATRRHLADDIVAMGPLAEGVDDIMWSYRDGVWSPDRHVVRNRAATLLGQRYRRAPRHQRRRRRPRPARAHHLRPRSAKSSTSATGSTCGGRPAPRPQPRRALDRATRGRLGPRRHLPRHSTSSCPRSCPSRPDRPGVGS